MSFQVLSHHITQQIRLDALVGWVEYCQALARESTVGCIGIVQLRRDDLKQHHTLCTAVCKEAVNPTQYLLWEHPFQPSPQQDSGLSDSAEAKFFRL